MKKFNLIVICIVAGIFLITLVSNYSKSNEIHRLKTELKEKEISRVMKEQSSIGNFVLNTIEDIREKF